MHQSKIRKSLSIVLLILFGSSCIIYLFEQYKVSFIPVSLDKALLLWVSIFLGVSVFLANLNSVYALFQKIFDNKDDSQNLTIDIEKATVKLLQRGHYRVHINLRICAKEKDVTLKKIYLKSYTCLFAHLPQHQDTPFSEIGFPVKFLMPYQESDLLKMDSNEYDQKIETIQPELLRVRDFCVRRDSCISRTFSGDIQSERLNDGYEELPVDDWKFLFEYDDKLTVHSQFSFEIHSSSPKQVVQYAYTGFKNKNMY